jgi:hypothetical protein
MHRLDDYYDVYAFDRALNLVRKGRILTRDPVRIYGLYEIKSDHESFAEIYRGRWCLAVGVMRANEPYDPALPSRPWQSVYRATEDGADGEEGDWEEFNALDLELVEWWQDEPEELRYWPVDVDSDARLEIRPAEAGGAP